MDPRGQPRDEPNAPNQYAPFPQASPVNACGTNPFSSTRGQSIQFHAHDGNQLPRLSHTAVGSNGYLPSSSSPSLTLPPILNQGDLPRGVPSFSSAFAPNPWTHFAPQNHPAAFNDFSRQSVHSWPAVNTQATLPPIQPHYDFLPSNHTTEQYGAVTTELNTPPYSAAQQVPSSVTASSHASSPQYAFASPYPQGRMHSSSAVTTFTEFPWPVERKLTENGLTCDGLPVIPKLYARMEKGFANQNNKWTCYRRNYFEVSAAYTLDQACAGKTILLKGSKVQSFGLFVSASIEDPNLDYDSQRTIDIVQFTPKRDNAQKRPLKIVKVWPGMPLHSLPNTSRNGYYNATRGQILVPNLPYQDVVDPDPQPFPAHVSRFATDTVPMVDFGNDGHKKQHAFERCQFKTATANNGKRRATQQYYRVKAQLFADTRLDGEVNGAWTKIAELVSDPVVVRGRSPNHYKDEDKPTADEDGSNDSDESPPNNGGPSPSVNGAFGYGYGSSLSSDASRPNYGGFRGYYPSEQTPHGPLQQYNWTTNGHATAPLGESDGMFDGHPWEQRSFPMNGMQTGISSAGGVNYAISPGAWPALSVEAPVQQAVPRSLHTPWPSTEDMDFPNESGTDHSHEQDFHDSSSMGSSTIKFEDLSSPHPNGLGDETSFFSEAMDEDTSLPSAGESY